MAQIKIVPTADGSNTLYSEQYKAHYHSLNGALQESLHVFIKNGYDFLTHNKLNILEVGFGTGLNAALSASKAIEKSCNTHYTGIDIIPLNKESLSKLNYSSVLSEEAYSNWQKIVATPWGDEFNVNDYFTLKKIQADFTGFNPPSSYDLIYFDAFAPEDQPEMWSVDIFEKLYKSTNPEGILVTYCSKGIVKQALREVGYKVERLSGPAGKRHIIRATKS